MVTCRPCGVTKMRSSLNPRGPCQLAWTSLSRRVTFGDVDADVASGARLRRAARAGARPCLACSGGRAESAADASCRCDEGGVMAALPCRPAPDEVTSPKRAGRTWSCRKVSLENRCEACQRSGGLVRKFEAGSALLNSGPATALMPMSGLSRCSAPTPGCAGAAVPPRRVPQGRTGGRDGTQRRRCRRFRNAPVDP